MHRLLPITLTAATACATAQRPPPADTPKIVMEPMRIQTQPDPLTGLDTYDAGDLLERGNTQFDAGAYDIARQIYDVLIARFPDSSLVATALYNAALCLEKNKDYAGAAERFKRVIGEHPRSPHAKDAHYQLSLSLAKLERWSEVADTFWAIRQMEGLTPMDEIEARTGMAVAMFMQGDYATSEREFLSTLRFYDEHDQKEYLPAKYWIGQSRFYIGEIVAREFEGLKLEIESVDHEAWKEEIAQKLERKCDLLLRAQNHFIRTIREGHTGWATAAGYRIGSLYERLYDDMLAIPVPPGIDDEARAFYLEEVRKRVAVLVKKAVQIYERSLDMAQRVGESNEWVERTSRALERMKTLALETIEREGV